MKYRCLLVDDEPIARKVLREELENLDSIEIIGEADNGENCTFTDLLGQT